MGQLFLLHRDTADSMRFKPNSQFRHSFRYFRIQRFVAIPRIQINRVFNRKTAVENTLRLRGGFE